MNNSKKLKRIAFGIHSLRGGGAERVISILANQFSNQGYEVHVICNIKKENEYPLNDSVIRHYIGYKTSRYHIASAVQLISRIRSICKKERIDILVSFMAMAEYSVIATFGLKTKCIISIRIFPAVHYTTLIKRVYARLLFNVADGAVFQTKEAQQWFLHRIQRKSTIILNPVKSEFYSVKRNVIPGLIVASGRLTSQKNYFLMLHAFSTLVENHAIMLEIYGEGEDNDKLEELTKELKIEGAVRFCGQTNDMPNVLGRADYYWMTSDFEGLPNALMEAMAVGIPCICTDSLGGGAKMLIGNDERGILVPCNNEKALVDALDRLYNNETLKLRVSEKAHDYAKHFSVDNCFATWESYLVNVLNKNN